MDGRERERKRSQRVCVKNLQVGNMIEWGREEEEMVKVAQIAIITFVRTLENTRK